MFDNMTTMEIIKTLAPLIAIEILLMLFCLYRLYKDKVRYLPKWGWLLIILIFNLIGPIAYLLIGRERE